MPMIAQITELEAKGFGQERYRALDARFHDWNWGVLDHTWTLVNGLRCALCESTGPSVLVKATAICLTCLNEYPLVPWHPTGAIRPRVQAFLTHATGCEAHTQN